MSEFLAEARVLVRPDTTKFRAELQAQLNAAAASIKPIAVPVIPIASGAAAGQAAGALKTFNETTKNTTSSLLGAASASGKLDAALLGLRTAAGSSAVIGLSAVSLGAILAGKALRAMISDAAALETELNTFQATTGASADQMARVSDAAKDLGADVRLPAVSASDAAIAMTELAKAGLSVEDSISGAAGVLELATAAQISNAQAAQIAANALNSFGLAGEDAVKVADDLANAANASQGSIADMGLALQQASAVARQVGLSLEDTTSLLSLFAKNGLQGSDAGTALRVALVKLIAPTDKAAAEIKKLGLNIRDAQGNLRADIFAQFGQATRNLTPAMRDASAAIIFGQDAIRAVAIGAREGTDGLRLMQFQIDQTGTAAELAAARTQGFGGEVSALSSNLQTLGTAGGAVINSFLTPVVRGLNEAATAANKAANAISDFFDRVSQEAEEKAGPGSAVDNFIQRLGGLTLDIPGIQGIRGLRKEIGLVGDTSVSSSERVRALETSLRELEKARIAAEQGGQRGVADRLTQEIKALRQEIKALKDEGRGVNDSVASPLREAITQLEKVRALRIHLNIDTTSIDRLLRSLRESIPITVQTEGNINRLRDDFLGLSNAADKATSSLDKTNAAMKNLSRQSVVLSDELLKLQSEGGSPAQQIAVLQQDIDTQRQIIEAAQAHGNQPGDATAIRKAREQIIADQNKIDSLQAEIAADQKKATDAAKKRADDAAKQQEEQTKAFIEQFGGGRARRLRQAELAAALTEGAQDDLAVDKRIKKFLLDKRKAIRDRIKELKLHGDALKAARDAIKKLNDEIDRINNEIAQDQLNVQSQRERSIELDIELADINENQKRQISLRKKLIAEIKREIRVLHLTGNALKEKRNEIARINKEIEDIQKEQKKGSTLAQSQFEFLQSLQGFSANLLGNLIPGFATGGLVGNTSDTVGGRQVTPGVRDQVAGANAVARSSERTVRPIQVDTTNALLRQIVRLLGGNPTKGTGHPEAWYQRRWAGAVNDGVHGN